MPITSLLTGSNFTPEQRHVLELAFKQTLRKLDLVDSENPVRQMVARKVIEIGATGVTNAVAISEIAYRQLAPAIEVARPRARSGCATVAVGGLDKFQNNR